MIYKLLSLPKDLVGCFHDVESLSAPEWYCNSDPADRKVGSGGGTSWLIDRWLDDNPEAKISDRKIIIHAGGQSRRLPAYAPVGKILTPIPVFRWERGQKLSQNLLSLQLPLYEKIISGSPRGLSTLIASGDVLVRCDRSLPDIPEADVVCFGTWVDASLATRHGVFVSNRHSPSKLDFMLQKPTMQELESYSASHYFLMDVGIWLLSGKALNVLSQKSRNSEGEIDFYDLYSQFGRALGENPTLNDSDVNELSVAILPLPEGEFYHFGTSMELISSTTLLQNIIVDQRKILQSKIKPNPSLFVQNSLMGYRLSDKNDRVWVENSNISSGWRLHNDHVLTGIPVNNWTLEIPTGICVDIVPLQNGGSVVRPYGIKDSMNGNLNDKTTYWMGQSFIKWATDHKVDLHEESGDIQFAPIFPIVYNQTDMGAVLEWMISGTAAGKGRDIWLNAKKISAAEISSNADLSALYKQREEYRRDNWTFLADNHNKSIFYQLDLTDVAENFVKEKLKKPELLPTEQATLKRIQNLMLRSRIDTLLGRNGTTDERKAFELLREEILSCIDIRNVVPKLSVQSDQIVWGRSPVRIDLAGGWTDTPPYCLYSGGKVVNMAIDLNDQQPLQVYIKPSKELNIVLRSIDLGATEIVTDFEGLENYCNVGTPFSIPKAALFLAGFRRRKDSDRLIEVLKDFGSGIEITLMSAIPAGSGLGTSSILAATVLGALSDFCGLSWAETEICNRTLALEQLLTAGGGWQDQYGGVLPGIKLLQTDINNVQIPLVSWLPQQIFTSSEYQGCHLLYYTGITRIAKDILAEIVRGMFLNSSSHLSILSEMKDHALRMADAIQHNNFQLYGRLIGEIWSQNKKLDAGTEPTEVKSIIRQVADLCYGYKLAGAGGGGFLYMVAKDLEAAGKIRRILTCSPSNERARFVDMKLSDKGFQVTRS